MFAAYWGFSRWPFLRNPAAGSPDFGQSFEESLARLLYLVDKRRRCGLLTGPAGTGKSRLFRRVRSYALRKGACCLDLDATAADADSILEQLVSSLSGEPGGSPWECLREHWSSCAVVGQPLVLFGEHLDLAEPGATSVLRRLVNLADSVRCDLTLLMSARKHCPLGALDDAVELAVTLAPWSADETAEFVIGSLASVGSANVFSNEALERIHEMTRGIPGEVIRICDLSLLAAMHEERPIIDADVVSAAAVEADPDRWVKSQTSRELAIS